MQFTVASVLALAATAFAQTKGFTPILTPTEGEVVPAGSTYTIKWQDTTGSPVTISLLGGASFDKLIDLGPIASAVDSKAAQYAWSVSSSLGKDSTYGIKISLDSNPATFQYGFPFSIKAGSGGNSTSSASGSASGYPTITSLTSSSAAPTVYSTISPIGNLSTTAAPATTTAAAPTTVVVVTSAGNFSASRTSVTPSASSRAPTTVPSAAAGRVVAGSVALVGGIAAAIFAL